MADVAGRFSYKDWWYHVGAAVPRGLDPVLIAGTQGEFDPWIQFVNMPLELVMEQWWVERKLLIPSDFFRKYPVLRSNGSPDTWRELCPITPVENAVVATETTNPEWVAITHLVPQRQEATSGLLLNKARTAVNSQPMTVDINYDLRFDDSYVTEIIVRDYRYSYVHNVRRICLQRYLGKFDFIEVGHRLDGETGLEYEGRGWKRFNHDHLHTITGNLGIDLRDPAFLTGTCAFMEVNL